MARGINKVIIVGNLGRDPETKALPNGSSVTNVALATSDSWLDKTSGKKVERTEWHRVVFFNKLAEIAAQYLEKGSKIYVEGSLRTRKWQDKTDGSDRYSTEIIGAEMQMLDSRGENGAQNNQQQQAPAQAPAANSAPQQQPAPLDDNIPF